MFKKVYHYCCSSCHCSLCCSFCRYALTEIQWCYHFKSDRQVRIRLAMKLNVFVKLFAKTDIYICCFLQFCFFSFKFVSSVIQTVMSFCSNWVRSFKKCELDLRYSKMSVIEIIFMMKLCMERGYVCYMYLFMEVKYNFSHL